MPKRQTSKHRRQKKRELANRMAKQQAELLDRIAVQPLVTEVHLPEPEPVSPARRAYQNL